MAQPRNPKAVYDANSVRVRQLCTAKDAERALCEDFLGHLASEKEI